MSFQTVYALVLRNLYLYTRTPIRLIELLFWPVVDLLVWGFLTTYLLRQSSTDFPETITFLIGAVILWDVIFRAQQGVAIFFLEDVWSRNLLNIFAAPVRNAEYLAATYTIGFLRACVTGVILSVIAITCYHFDVLQLSWYLLPFVINLLLFGWALGMIATALIVRWGPAAETLAWATPFFIQPFAAVFYPVSAFPEWLQPISLSLPCTHIFEGMRAVLATGAPAENALLYASGLNVLYLAFAGWLFAHVMKTAREKGLLTKFSSQ